MMPILWVKICNSKLHYSLQGLCVKVLASKQRHTEQTQGLSLTHDIVGTMCGKTIYTLAYRFE